MSSSPKLKRRFERIRPLDQIEVAVVRAATERPGWLSSSALNALRYVLSLARVEVVPLPDGEVDLGGAFDGLRDRVVESLGPWVLDASAGIEHDEVASAVPFLVDLAEKARAAALTLYQGRLTAAQLDAEVCHKALIVVAGGGGGSGYVYGGAFKLMHEVGWSPSMIVGTSIGSLLGLFRARHKDLALDPLLSLADRTDWRSVFMLPAVRNRYGVPATLRLYLRKTIAHLFQHPTEPRTLQIGELPIPFRVVVAGLNSAGLTRDMSYYEHLADAVVGDSGPTWSALRRTIGGVASALTELVARPTVLKEIVLGGDDLTRQFDVVDAVGFSTAVPGLIHYDILRDDPHMHSLMDRLFARHGVARLIDGGLMNNVPSRIAWEHVQRGDIGTRNAFVLAMDCFAPQLTRNVLMHPIQRLVRPQVASNAPYAGLTKTFVHVLSPLDVVPDARKVDQALRAGYREMEGDRALLRALQQPLRGLDGAWGDAGPPRIKSA